MLRSVLVVVLVLLLLPVAAYGILAAAVGRDAVWSTLFGPPQRPAFAFEAWDRAPRDNEFILCPAALCPGPVDGAAPVYAMAPAALRAAWEAMIARQPRVRLLSEDAARQQLDYEQRTPLLRFPDTVTVRFLPAGEGRSTLAVYSRSHYGKDDLGTNRARVTRWLAALDAETAPVRSE